MKILPLVGGALLLAVLLAPATPADHSTWECPYFGAFILPETGYQESAPAYVTLDGVLTDNQVLHLWIYAESNGVDALQRHDLSCQTAGWDDPDRLLF